MVLNELSKIKLLFNAGTDGDIIHKMRKVEPFTEAIELAFKYYHLYMDLVRKLPEVNSGVNFNGDLNLISGEIVESMHVFLMYGLGFMESQVIALGDDITEEQLANFDNHRAWILDFLKKDVRVLGYYDDRN